MRPLKLTMTAFGPYAKSQVIDFTELQGRNLFLITGPTGSGKTTIFDAICFAIFGKASGRDRDGESLRSHFAQENLLTSVELEFELKGKKYWVKRFPKQVRKKALGEGFTEQNAQAEFKALDDPQSRVVVGVRNVDEKITQLIGITYEQFKQIIMIPQGEFRELLTADSTTREVILQKIFGTQEFKLIQERIGEKAKELEKGVELLKKQREINIAQFNAADHEDLAALLTAKPYNIMAITTAAAEAICKDEEQEEEYKKLIQRLEEHVAGKQKEIFKAQENNRKIKEKERALEEKNKLEAQKPFFIQKEKALEKARKALAILPLEDNYRSRVDEYNHKAALLKEAEENEKNARSQLAAAEKALAEEKQRDTQREGLSQKLTLLQEARKKVQDWQHNQKGLQEAELALKTVQKEQRQLEEELQELKRRQELSEQSLNQSMEAARKYIIVCNEKERVQALHDTTLELQKEREKLGKDRQGLDNLKARLDEQESAFQELERNYEEAKNKYFTGLAGVLAEQLQEGKACPVCGSLLHPNPASKATGVLNEQELKDLEQRHKIARDKLESVRLEWQNARAKVDFQEKTVRRLEQELSELSKEGNCEGERDLSLDTRLLELKEVLAELEAEMKQLEVLKDKENDLRRQIVKDNSRLTDLEKKLKELAGKEKDLYSKVEMFKGLIKALEEDLPAAVRTPADMENELSKTQKLYNDLKRALEEAEERLKECREALLTADADKKHTLENMKEAEIGIQKALAGYQEALAKAGFSGEEEYRFAKMTPGQIEDTEKEINEYKESLKSASDNLERLQKEVQGLSYIDISVLERQLLAIQQEKQKVTDRKTFVRSRLDHNQKMLTSIINMNKDIEDKEREYALVGDLANTARGNNSQKLTFERYVLAAYFNDIIAAANIRLQKMTCGRYKMSRIAEKGKGAAQSGLELEVFDYYTGRARHVKTLSGGESFKASLALALGLADVVQSYAGGVNLDTMFVDEGFGTLDPESLDNAINCLIELQQAGRLVGIISHVPELRACIDARLEVEAHKDGSTAKFYIG
ncbi:MAG TPA: AAA family ATPase [Peptococcaceae bacterium]|nr:AAA family ATPase [Peptococcaceae bacterium]